MTISSLILAISFLPFFEAKNAAVNNIIDPSYASSSKGATAEKPELLHREKCPLCKATGIIVLEEKNFGQFNEYRLDSPKVIRQKCPFCFGYKFIEAFYNPTELKLLVARERLKFESDHQAKGEIPVGKAFIPKESYDKMDRKATKLIKEAYGEPCKSCHWLGITACKECDGNGFIECKNKDCKDGWSVTKTQSTYTKTTSNNRGSRNNCCRNLSSSGSRKTTRTRTNINVQQCTECLGAGIKRCPDCHGRRALPCKKCNGIGTK